mgnify:CR=1 FL=1
MTGSILLFGGRSEIGLAVATRMAAGHDVVLAARRADDPPAYYAANLEFHAALLQLSQTVLSPTSVDEVIDRLLRPHAEDRADLQGLPDAQPHLRGRGRRGGRDQVG